MKSVCLTIVRNEADIIETFVRYHIQKFDHLFITDHNSRDGTGEILQHLVKEGLPITVYKESSPYHIQGERITIILKEIRKKHKPIVLMPLDADEFVVGDLKEAAHELPDARYTLSVLWKNYAPTINDNNDVNVLRRICHRSRNTNLWQHKVLIPGLLIDHQDVHVKEGCHELYNKDGQLPLITSKKIYLAHFPVRTANQLMRKGLVGWVSKVANPHNEKRPEWSHWWSFFKRAKEGNISLLELQCLALGYSFSHSEFQNILKTHSPEQIFQMEYAPVQFDGIDIKHPYDDNCYSPLEAIADAAELLAEGYSALAKQFVLASNS